MWSAPKPAQKTGAFDDKDRSYPGEQFPSKIVSEGISFTLGSAEDGQKNALACDGQTIAIPAGTSRVYVLAAASGGDLPGTFSVGDQKHDIIVQNWSAPIGMWDNRLWKGKVSELTYNWDNRLDGLVPGFIKRDTVAWYADHRRHPEAGNEIYEYCYMFKYGFDVPAGATELTLPKNDKIRVFAITAATNAHDSAVAAAPLYDTLDDRAKIAAPTAEVVGDAAR